MCKCIHDYADDNDFAILQNQRIVPIRESVHKVGTFGKKTI